jgi:hypothetical protein
MPYSITAQCIERLYIEMTERLERARSGKVTPDELTTQFDYMIDLIQKMKSLLALSASALNAYDLQQSQKVKNFATSTERIFSFNEVLYALVIGVF